MIQKINISADLNREQLPELGRVKPNKLLPTVLITGILGQIGSYIAEEYLNSGYDVHGIMRRSGIDNYDNIKDIQDKITLHIADITDNFSLLRSFDEVKPDLVINCAAQSEVGTSFTNPATTFDITGKGVLNLLEIIRLYYPKCKFLQFSSSEMFGHNYSNNRTDGRNAFQYENTNMGPLSPYAVAKLAGYNMVRVYRKSYGLFASNIIAFNSEGPRRKDYFVTRKITKWLAEFLVWMDKNHLELDPFEYEGNNIVSDIGYTFPKLALGNIDSVRSWTHAKDTARAAKMILNHTEPDDFCIGREDCYTIKDFLTTAFSYKGLNWQDFVYQDEKFMRPNDLTYLKPYTEKARKILGWSPEITFKELVKEMVDSDYEKAKRS